LHRFIKFVMSMLIMWGQSNEDQELAYDVHVDSSSQVWTCWSSRRCRQSMSIGSSNSLEIKQRSTQGVWLRPKFKQQPGTQVDKGSSSSPGFKSVVSSRWAAGGRKSERETTILFCTCQFLLFWSRTFAISFAIWKLFL
jgi:hypothetical protein